MVLPTYLSLNFFIDFDYILLKGGIPVRRAWPFFCSDKDQIFLGQASIGIRNDLQKNIFYTRKKTP